ncbi:fatty acid hydroxylase domain-containing protein 2 [Takifugu flavidus]|uniref:Fatty acid hydroxylase domain-containing protein 2 n=1 Tax=Takifugu flavidus TaxID=433684 RepID=A0A5C6P6P0_9TELE|nr:fatty acid hydroxylase domain-containing protein 2 [Takifugu flavidus]TWW75085.1 Fatty acid hydroxylase domain-containing protein 2 [Takifugu flavidus]
MTVETSVNGKSRDPSGARGEQESNGGGLWDSVKKAAFIIGSGILFLAAFGNSLTWHLQRFWGASGDFWQDLWTKLCVAFEGHDEALFYFGTMLLPSLTFWGLNALLLVVDTTGKPSFITRYRIQLDKNNPVDPAKLRQALKCVTLNQLFISGPIVVGVYHLMSLRGTPCSPELPTFHRALMELAFFSILEEIMFYYSHRLFHQPNLYKRFHKQHHEWTAPIGVVATYAHPLEHVLSNLLPVVIGPVILGSHVSTTSMWYCVALISTTISHCGYHLPFLPSPEFHDFHHLRFNQCYGVFGVLDRLHGTDDKFRQSKQYERHTLLTGLTPLNESIPDAPKKAL